jgi:hypothetical protein
MGALSARLRHADKLYELRRMRAPRSFGIQFEPRYIFRAGRLDQ